MEATGWTMKETIQKELKDYQSSKINRFPSDLSGDSIMPLTAKQLK